MSSGYVGHFFVYILGTFGSGGTCLACFAGYYSLPNSTSCTQCPANTYSISSSASCIACPIVNNTAIENTAASVCGSCPQGTTPVPGACKQCSPGYYSEFGRFCQPCSPGEYSVFSAGSPYCLKCPRGYYSQTGLADRCLSCPAGSFASATGSTECEKCAAGTFTSFNGSSTCETVPEGTFTIGGSSTPVQCVVYEPTEVENALASYCVNCKSGYSSARGGCRKCSVGFYNTELNITSCTACSRGTFQPDTASSSCITCNVGYYSVDGSGTCKRCADTVFKAGQQASSIASMCDECPYDLEPVFGGCRMCNENEHVSGKQCTPKTLAWAIAVPIILVIGVGVAIIVVSIILVYVAIRRRMRSKDKQLLELLLQNDELDENERPLSLVISMPMIEFEDLTALVEIGNGGSGMYFSSIILFIGAIVLKCIYQGKDAIVKLFKVDDQQQMEFETEVNLLATLRDKVQYCDILLTIRILSTFMVLASKTTEPVL